MTIRHALLLSAILVTSLVSAQQNSRTGEVRRNANAQKAVQIQGRLQDAGTRFYSEDGGVFAITNPQAFASESGHRVTVKCILSNDQNSIQVLSVHRNEPKYVAYGDAAFRK